MTFSVLTAVADSVSEETLKNHVNFVQNFFPGKEMVYVFEATAPDWLKRKTVSCIEDAGSIGNSLFLGVEIATSEYIIKLDVGDRLKGCIKTQIQSFAKSENIAVIGAIPVIAGHRIRLPKRVSWLHLLLINPLSHSGVLLKKSKILKIGNYNRNLSQVEDLDLWFRLKKNRYRLVNESDLEVIFDRKIKFRFNEIVDIFKVRYLHTNLLSFLFFPLNYPIKFIAKALFRA